MEGKASGSTPRERVPLVECFARAMDHWDGGDALELSSLLVPLTAAWYRCVGAPPRTSSVRESSLWSGDPPWYVRPLAYAAITVFMLVPVAVVFVLVVTIVRQL